jgi:hypothetical protein
VAGITIREDIQTQRERCPGMTEAESVAASYGAPRMEATTRSWEEVRSVLYRD